MNPTGRVTRSDIESKLGEIQGSLTEQAEDARSRATPILIAAAVAVVVLAFFVGKRRGKKQTTIVEIRRV